MKEKKKKKKNSMKQESKTYKVIISGGGTGGHIYPAIAIANALKELLPQVDILFVGAEGRMEMEKVPKAGYKIIGLPITGIQRSLSFKNIIKNLQFPFKLLKSMRLAKKIVKDFNPDIAIGVGGFASGPLLRAATGMGVPALIQEQNSFAGKTNKWLADRVRKICVAYEGMDAYFSKEKMVNLGNPVRKDILEGVSKREEALSHFKLENDKPVLLIIGGSLGARTINQSIKGGLKELTKNNIQVIWQTGKWFNEEANQAVNELKSDLIHVHEFVYEMDLAYAAADVVISRAGALSISELCLVKKPTILVPSPNVAEDHQTKNAMALVNKEAALLVKDSDAQHELITKVLALSNDEKLKNKLSNNIGELGKPDAAQDIAQEVIKILN